MKIFEAHELFNKTFRVGFLRFIDPKTTAIFNEPKLDLIKFGDWLFKEFNESSLSIRELVEKKFGIEIVKKLEELV